MSQRKPSGRFAPKPQAQEELPTQRVESERVQLLRALDKLENERAEMGQAHNESDREIEVIRQDASVQVMFQQNLKASIERTLRVNNTEIENVRLMLNDLLGFGRVADTCCIN